MADNKDILLSFGVDEKSLKSAVKQIVTGLRSGVEETLKNKPIKLPTLDISNVKTKGSLDLSNIKHKGFIEIPIDKIRWTGGAIDLSKIPIKGAVNTGSSSSDTTGKAGTAGTDAPQRQNVIINQQEINATTAALEKLKQSLTGLGAKEKEAAKQTQELTRHLKQVQTGYENVQIARNARIAAGGSSAYTDSEVEKIFRLQQRLSNVNRELLSFDKNTATSNINTQRATDFMESFGFKVGILGFSLGILGGHLQRLTQNLVMFITSSAKAAEPLERIRNLVTQLVDAGDIPADQKDTIFNEINRLADLPGSSLDAVTSGFRKLLVVTKDVGQSLALVEQLTKATGRSGTGARGLEQLIFQLAQFAESGQLMERDIKSIKEQGGADISKIVSKIGGKEGIQELGPKKFFAELVAGLTEVRAPLDAAQDKLNRIDNSLTRIRLNILELLKPGLDALLETFKGLETVVASLTKRFEALSPETKEFIGSSILGIVALTGALAGLLTVLAAVGIALAGGKHLLETFGVTTKNLLPSIRGLAVQWNSWSKLSLILAPATGAVNTFGASVTSLPSKIKGSIFAVINYFKELAFFAQLKGVGIFGGAKGNTIIEFIKLLGTGVRTSGGLLAALSTAATTVQSLGGGLLRIIGFTTPLGILLNVIVALVTNFGNFRTKVVEGFKDIYDSFKRFYDVFTKFSETKAGTFILAALGLILDAIEAIFAVAGSAVQFILNLIGNAVDLVTDFLDLFNSESFPDFLNRLGALTIRFTTGLLKSIGKLVLNLFGDLINFSAGFLVKMKLVSPEAVKEFNEQLQSAKDNLDDLNVSVKDGKIVIDRYSTALEKQKEQLDQCVVDLDEVRAAYEKLTVEADKAHKELEKKVSTNAVDVLDTRISEAQANMSRLAEEYKNSLDKMSDPANINRANEALNKALKVQLDIIRNALNERTKVQVQATQRELSENSLIKAALGTSLAPHVQQVLEAKDLNKVKEALDVYQQLAKASGQVDSNTAKVWAQMSSAFKFLLDADAKKINELNNSTENLRRNIQKAYDDRMKQIGAENANRQRSAELAEYDAKIAEANEKIAAIKAEREERLITTSVERSRIVIQEKIKAEQEYLKDLAKLAVERSQLNADDYNGQADLNRKEENLKVEHNAKLGKIDENAKNDAAKTAEKANAERLARLQDSQATLLKVIEPFQEQLFKLLARTQTDGLEKTATGINSIASALETIGGEIPGMKEFVQSLRDLTSGESVNLSKILVDLVRLPAKTELNNNIREAVRSLKPIIMDALINENEDFKDPVTLVYGDSIPPAIAAILGVKPNGELTVNSRKQLSDAIDKASIDISDMIRAGTSVQGWFEQGKIPLADFEEFMAQFSKVLEANTKVQDINLNQANAILMAMDKALANVQNTRLDTLLSQIQAQIAIFEEENVRTGLSKNLEKIRKLKVQEQIFIYQKTDLDIQFKALEKIRDTKDAEEKKELFKTLQNERVRLYKEAQKQIEEASGGISGKSPKLTPINLPGTDGSEPEESKPGSDSGGEDTIVNKVNKVKQSLEDLRKAGREARDAILGLFEALASGEYAVDAFADVIFNGGSMLEAFKELALDAFAALGQAIGQALVDSIANGENFFKAIGKIFGRTLIQIGSMLIQVGIAALAMSILAKFFPILAPLLNPKPGGKAAALAAIAVGTGLVAAGALMGGGSSSASQTASTNTSNSANASTGATGQGFDPNKDPKTIYQKALAAQILIDIRTDSGQIVKTVIKDVNNNGRLATLIGNRKLQFGY